MVPALILSIIFFSFVLIKSADLLIVSLTKIARRTHIRTFALSSIVLAIGTSFPELFVGITSAIEKAPNLTLGVVIGSNIANIALVAGLTAFIAGKINVQGEFIKKDVWIAFAAGLLPIALFLDGSLNRVDGLILLSVYFAYATGFFRERFEEVGKHQKKGNIATRFFKKVGHIETKDTKEYGKFFVGIALLLASSDIIVRLSQNLAEIAGVPIFFIGLIILAAGTSLPEFAFSLRSIRDHHPSMFFGNLLGSTIANSTLVLGITTLIHPINISENGKYIFAAMVFAIVFILFWYFSKTKQELTRKEAVVLLLVYSIFVLVEVIK